MTILKTTLSEFLNESIIRPYNFDSAFDELISKEGNINSLDDVNDIFKDLDVYVSDIEEFESSDWSDEERTIIPRDVEMIGGVRFGVYNYKTNKMNLVVIPSKFIAFLNRPYNKDTFFDFINEILRHESIHKQQVQRMTGGEKKLKDSPSNPKDYFSNKNEIMAYAQSFVDQMKKQGRTNNQILNMMRNDKVVGSWTYDNYKRVVDEDTLKRFQKYAYLYLQDS